MINNRYKTGFLMVVILASITTLGFNNKCVEEVKAIDKDTVINNQIYIDNTSRLSNFSKYKLKIDRESEFNRQIYNSEYEYIANCFKGNTVEFPKKQEIVYKEDNTAELTEKQEAVYTGFIQNSCNASNKFLISVNNYWNMIPSNVREVYINSGSTITVVNNLGYLGLSTFYITNEENRYVTIEIDYRDKAKDAVIHEVGHFLSWYLALDLNGTSNEFYAIWAEEYPNILSIDNTNIANVNTAHEYFAESFAMSILKPDLMKTACPKTYDYIWSCINSI